MSRTNAQLLQAAYKRTHPNVAKIERYNQQRREDIASIIATIRANAQAYRQHCNRFLVQS